MRSLDAIHIIDEASLLNPARGSLWEVELECLKKVFMYIDSSKDNKLDWMEISDVPAIAAPTQRNLRSSRMTYCST